MSAAVVEDEAPHEIYAGLVAEGKGPRRGGSGTTTDDTNSAPADAPNAPADAPSNRGRSRRRPRSHASNPEDGGVTLIPTDDRPAESSSQFINFYRSSLQAQHSGNATGASRAGKRGPPSQPGGDTASKPKPQAVKRGKSSSSPAKEPATTKSERRRRRKQEQERNARRERRVRMMLRSDFTEEDEILYRNLGG
ncbi:hypothetical protein ACHAXT_006190 [Thalassiosira profunda]